MSATKIIAGAYGFACDEENRTGFFNIAVRSNLIVEVSTDLAGLKRKYPEAEIVDASEKIVLPTLFNSHFHPESMLSRLVEPKLPISQWRSEHLLALESSLDSQDESFYEKMYHLTFFGALQCGVSAISFAVIGDEAGTRGMYSAVKLTGIDAIAFAESEQQISFLRKIVDRHLKSGIFVPYQKDLTLFGLSAVARNNSDSPGWIMTHADEDIADIETTKANFNSGVVQLLKKSRILNSSTILVGLNSTPASSLKLAKSSGAKIVLVPETLNPQTYKSVRNVFDTFAIGSNWETPGMFPQMKKLLELGCEPFEALTSATRAGADLFNMSSKLGSIEAGKVASMAFMDTKKLSARRLERLPAREAAAALIEDYGDPDVSDVMLDGEFVYRDRKLLLYDTSELLKEAHELIDRVSRYTDQTAPSAEEKIPPMRVPETRAENTNESDQESKKVELPKNIRKVFGEDEF
jgi:5-methylthioadenosine/S-adenosylhomocysteine deaminase